MVPAARLPSLTHPNRAEVARAPAVGPARSRRPGPLRVRFFLAAARQPGAKGDGPPAAAARRPHTRLREGPMQGPRQGPRQAPARCAPLATFLTALGPAAACDVDEPTAPT